MICSDTNDKRLLLAKKLGADIVINPLKEDVTEVVKDATDGRGADRPIVCTGASQTFNPAIHMTRSGGRVVVIGVIHDHVDLNHMDFFCPCYQYL